MSVGTCKSFKEKLGTMLRGLETNKIKIELKNFSHDTQLEKTFMRKIEQGPLSWNEWNRNKNNKNKYL